MIIVNLNGICYLYFVRETTISVWTKFICKCISLFDLIMLRSRDSDSLFDLILRLNLLVALFLRIVIHSVVPKCSNFNIACTDVPLSWLNQIRDSSIDKNDL